MDLQPGKLNACDNNVIVWTGPGDFPGNIAGLSPGCVTVTKDKSVWENARNRWIAEHPQVMRLAGDPKVVDVVKEVPVPYIPQEAIDAIRRVRDAAAETCQSVGC